MNSAGSPILGQRRRVFGALLSDLTDFDLPHLVDKGAQLEESARTLIKHATTREFSCANCEKGGLMGRSSGARPF
jgi:hypothetical protein